MIADGLRRQVGVVPAEFVAAEHLQMNADTGTLIFSQGFRDSIQEGDMFVMTANAAENHNYDIDVAATSTNWGAAPWHTLFNFINGQGLWSKMIGSDFNDTWFTNTAPSYARVAGLIFRGVGTHVPSELRTDGDYLVESATKGGIELCTFHTKGFNGSNDHDWTGDECNPYNTAFSHTSFQGPEITAAWRPVTKFGVPDCQMTANVQNDRRPTRAVYPAG